MDHLLQWPVSNAATLSLSSGAILSCLISLIGRNSDGLGWLRTFGLVISLTCASLVTANVLGVWPIA